MSFGNWLGSAFKRIFYVKESQARALIALQTLGRPVSTPANYKGFSEEGYQKNVVAFRSIGLLSSSCKGIPWLVYRKTKTKIPSEIEDPNHGLVKLLSRPNPMQALPAFIESVIAYYCIAGNSYIEANGPGSGAPTELWPVRPDLMKVVAGLLGLPQAYEFTYNGQLRRFPVDVVNGKSPILHLKTFHPTDIWYGMSPIQAAAMSVDQHNESSKWNLSLLQNKAMPSGALVVTANDRNPSGVLADDQYNRLKDQIEGQFQGSKNAGRPLLLEAGLDWKQLSFSPGDMDWIEGKHTSARDISLAFGVPPILLNIPGDSTFANYKEARLALYEDTVLPLMDTFKGELNHWLAPVFGDGIYLDYDRDKIEALAPKREAVWARVQSADWLTVNEKREATGYEHFEGGDEILVPMSVVPLTVALGEAEDDDESDEHPTGDPEEDPTEVEDDETDTPDDENTDDAGADDNEDANGKSVKIFNLKTRAQKKRYVQTVLKQRDVLEKRFAKQVKGVFKKEGRALADAVKGVHSVRIAELRVHHVLDEHKKEMRSAIRANLENILKYFGTEVIKSVKQADGFEVKDSDTRFRAFIRDWIDTYAEPQIQGIYGTTLKRVQRAIKDAESEALDSGENIADISGKIQEAYDGFSDSRSVLIARTETTMAQNMGSLGAAKSLGVQLTKEWVAVNDDRTREDHADVDGVIIPIDGKFTVGGSEMDGPGDPQADISELANCRCILTYAKAEDDQED